MSHSADEEDTGSREVQGLTQGHRIKGLALGVLLSSFPDSKPSFTRSSRPGFYTGNGGKVNSSDCIVFLFAALPPDSMQERGGI